MTWIAPARTLTKPAAERGVVERVAREFRRIDADDVSIAHFAASLDRPTDGANNAVGVNIRSGKRIRIEHGLLTGFVTDKGTDHWQGDGVLIEDGAAEVTLRHIVAIGCGDAGFDIKGGLVEGDHLRAEQCRGSFKLWSTMSLGVIESIDPTRHGGGTSPMHVQVASKAGCPVTINMRYLKAAGTAPLFVCDTDPARPMPIVITVTAADIRAIGASPLLAGNAPARLTIAGRVVAERNR